MFRIMGFSRKTDKSRRNDDTTYAVSAPREHQDSNCHVLLSSGKLFDVLAPTYDVLSIEDVAAGLSVESRYAGQFPRSSWVEFYSVAQHSVLAAEYFDTAEFKLAALLHDSEEFILRDIPSPLKKLIPDYVALADSVRRKIFARFNVDYDLYPAIKEVDDKLYFRERANWWGDTRVSDSERIMPLYHAGAKSIFLKAWKGAYDG